MIRKDGLFSMTNRNGTETCQILVDTSQAAEMLGISRRKLAQLIATGVIPSRKIGRLRRFSVAELQAWVTDGCPNTPGRRERAPRNNPDHSMLRTW
ncbi:MAG: DNA-binding protein [Planctomycetaceae bacterium]|nr:MAG: DNA-binding protein [Planctomycetaceae bacterium]